VPSLPSPCRLTSFAAGVVALALLVAVAAACGGSPAASEAERRGPPTIAGEGCGRAPKPGNATMMITSGGRDRSARVHVPGGLETGRRIPVLLVLHGAGGDGPSFERYSRFSELADREGFVAVYPSAIDRFWTVGEDSSGPDDVRFLADLLDRVEGRTCVDPTRVYATGLSNGGGMAARLACELSERVVAVAPVAGAYGGLPPCRPPRTVSVLEMHGDADPIVSYEGSGPGRPDSARGFAAGWAERDGCAASPIRRRLAPTAVRLDWSGCRSGAAVSHVRILGGGHDIPGVTPRTSPPGAIFGPGEIWRFLAAHPRRGP
jgi:polyhydroxybutyrate depolymerase